MDTRSSLVAASYMYVVLWYRVLVPGTWWYRVLIHWRKIKGTELQFICRAIFISWYSLRQQTCWFLW